MTPDFPTKMSWLEWAGMLFGGLFVRQVRFCCLFGGVSVLSRIAERGMPLQIYLSTDSKVTTAQIGAFFHASYEVFGLLSLSFSLVDELEVIDGYSIAYNLARKSQLLRVPLVCFLHDPQVTQHPARLVTGRRGRSPEYNRVVVSIQ